MCFLSLWPVRFWPRCSPWRWYARSGSGEHWKCSCRGFLRPGGGGLIVLRRNRVILTAIVTLMAGCESHDGRLARYAQQATELQARQNEIMAQQSQAVAKHSQELAEAARQLVGQDAAARRELIAAHERQVQELQAERLNLDRQREHVEQRRQDLADAERREPLLAQSFESAALLLAALFPLLVALYAVRQLRGEDVGSDTVTEVLIEELTAAEPRFRLTSQPGPAPGLPSPPDALSDESSS